MNKIIDDTGLKRIIEDIYIGKSDDYHIVRPNNELINLATKIEDYIDQKDRYYHKGRGSLEGWIAELSVAKFLSYLGYEWTWTGAEQPNAIDYYVKRGYSNYSVNVKSKLRTDRPEDFFNVVVPARILENSKIEFNIVLFTNYCERDGVVFIIGWETRDRFMKYAKKKKKGQIIPYNFKLDEDVYYTTADNINRVFF